MRVVKYFYEARASDQGASRSGGFLEGGAHSFFMNQMPPIRDLHTWRVPPTREIY